MSVSPEQFAVGDRVTWNKQGYSYRLYQKYGAGPFVVLRIVAYPYHPEKGDRLLIDVVPNVSILAFGSSHFCKVAP